MTATRIWIVLVLFARDSSAQRRIRHTQRKNRDTIKRFTCWNETSCTQETATWLETYNLIERGWHAPRAGRIRAQANWDQPARHNGSRARTRTTTDVFVIERVRHSSVR